MSEFTMTCRRLGILVGVLLGAIITTGAFGFTAYADDIFMKRSWDHAVGGYDVVAYHTKSAAVEGDPAYEAQYLGASWLFSSQENLDLFNANPDAYRPQYGGYCAWAMAKGKKAPGDPNVWHILDGKLYLNVSQGIKRRWLKDIDGFIERADAEWAKL